MSIGYTPHAAHDIDTVAEYLEAGRVGGGGRFQAALRRALARLERLPESAAEIEPPSPLYPGLRVTQLKKFDHYSVFSSQRPMGFSSFACSTTRVTSRPSSTLIPTRPRPQVLDDLQGLMRAATPVDRLTSGRVI